MKVNYSFTALNALFTGGDETAGTLRTLRREKRLLKQPVTFKSNFKSEQERTKELMNVIFPIYDNIDKRLKIENYGFYKAYANKVKAALSSENKKSFLNRLLESCGITSLAEGQGQIVRKALDKFSDIEFLEVARQEHQYLMILLREYVNFYRGNESQKVGASLSIWEDEEVNDANLDFSKNFENVPYFGGNSIRGYLRRIIMHDFCKLASIEKLNKNIYHQLFTGGNLNESTAFEDIEKREKYIAMCPAIGLLGSAIGNMTIEGDLKVVGGRLQCKENGTGNLSFWSLIEQNFATRLDSSKTEKSIEISDNTDEKSQMIYQWENFITGSVFDASFVLTTEEDLLVSAFWRMIKLWKEQPFIGGNSARDNGMIDIGIEIPKDADKLYLDYIKENSNDIKEYFNA